MITELTTLISTDTLMGVLIGVVSALLIFSVFQRNKAALWRAREGELSETLNQQNHSLLETQSENLALRESYQSLQHELHSTELKFARFDERVRTLEPLLKETAQAKQILEKRLEQTNLQLADRCEVITELETRLEAERSAHSEKLKTLEQAREQLKQEFQGLANRIFDEKSQRFTESNKESMGHLLTPLREQLGDFKRKVEDVYDKEAKDRRALYEQINNLKQLNQQMSEDAINLTNALKGDSKVQGNWGEVVLEKALEESGLRKGHEFELQFSAIREGKRFQPDAVIHLPDGKDIIVDAKVSLTAYEQYCTVEEDELKNRFLKEHLLSVKGHIRGLSEKSYESLELIRSLDFVLLFIPIEGAFLLALEKEPGLFKEAFDRNIMLVSPATLMVTLRTIHNIWRYEHQNQNAKQIAKRGGELHDKFVGFVESVDEIGRNIERTQIAFDKAHKRLISGRGNLVSQVAMLQKLGANTRKDLPADLLGSATDSLSEKES